VVHLLPSQDADDARGEADEEADFGEVNVAASGMYAKVAESGMYEKVAESGEKREAGRRIALGL
jgi:hypothetical protein